MPEISTLFKNLKKFKKNLNHKKLVTTIYSLFYKIINIFYFSMCKLIEEYPLVYFRVVLKS